MRWIDRIKRAIPDKRPSASPGETDAPETGKIPTTPLMLAVAILHLTSTSLTGILKAIHKSEGQQPTAEATARAFRELLCATYCLAVAILGEDNSAKHMGTEVFNVYTANVFSELGRPSGPNWVDIDREWGPIGLRADVILNNELLERACDVAIELYLHNQPDLQTLANTASEFCWQKSLVEPALQSNNWGGTFNIKAWISFARSMDLRASDAVRFYPAYVAFSLGTIESTKLFRGLQPAFHAE